MKVRLPILICLLPAMALLAARLVSPSGAAAPRPGENLLQNPSFDQKLSGWKPWFYQDVQLDADMKKRDSVVEVHDSFFKPYFQVAEPKWDQVTHGEDFVGAAGAVSGRRWTKFRAGFYQTVSVPPGSWVRFRVWVNEFCEDEAARRCPVRLRAGIDPTGGTDWQAKTVRWTEVQISDLQYVQLTPPGVQVGDKGLVTVFTWGEPLIPVYYNAAYVDDASLVITALPTPTGAAPTRQPPTPTPQSCAQMQVVSDVSVPENTLMPAGERFVKTWRIQNSGTCDWSGALSFVGRGDRMQAESPLPVPRLAVGQNADVSLDMVAPIAPGAYQSTWEMRADDGAVLGRLLVKINVPAATATATPPVAFTATPALLSQAGSLPLPTPGGGQVCLLAFEDGDGDGQQSAAELLLAGATFTLTTPGGASQVYTGDGSAESWCLADLAPGGYRVAMHSPPGYVETTLSTLTLVLKPGMRTTLRFGARPGVPLVTATPLPVVSDYAPSLEDGVGGSGWTAPTVATLLVMLALGLVVGVMTLRPSLPRG